MRHMTAVHVPERFRGGCSFGSGYELGALPLLPLSPFNSRTTHIRDRPEVSKDHRVPSHQQDATTSNSHPGAVSSGVYTPLLLRQRATKLPASSLTNPARAPRSERGTGKPPRPRKNSALGACPPAERSPPAVPNNQPRWVDHKTPSAPASGEATSPKRLLRRRARPPPPNVCSADGGGKHNSLVIRHSYRYSGFQGTRKKHACPTDGGAGRRILVDHDDVGTAWSTDRSSSKAYWICACWR